MEIIELILSIFGTLLVVVTLLPLLPADVWWVRVWEFLRIQLAVLILFVLLVYLGIGLPFGFWRVTLVGALLLCLVYHALSIVPYTPLVKPQVQLSHDPQENTQVRLLFVNVEMSNREAEKLKEIVRAADADVIIAAETDAWWQEQLAEFATTHPHTVWQPQENHYGLLLFSRLELVAPQVKFLVQDDVPSIHTEARLGDGRTVHLHCLHPRPPVPNAETEQSTERDAELLIVARQLENVEVPTIVLGDLNDVAWSHTTTLFTRISGLLDPRVGRGFYNSFHTRYPFLRFPLDHLYHSAHFRLVEFERLPAFGSDHFPMCVTLNLEPEAQAAQNTEEAAPADEAEAKEKINEATG